MTAFWENQDIGLSVEQGRKEKGNDCRMTVAFRRDADGARKRGDQLENFGNDNYLCPEGFAGDGEC